MTGISNLLAAELSQAAYPSEPIPTGWRALGAPYSAAVGGNSFTAFIDPATKQIVVAFKGTDFTSVAGGLSQLASDLQNDGGAAWESIAGAFKTALAALRLHFPGYAIMTDGHSLGGGMAQTAALEYGLSGYGQNALPISPAAIADDAAIASRGGFVAARAAWLAAGHTFSEVDAAGDPVALYYAGKAYLDSRPLILADPYAATELRDLATFNLSGLAQTAYDAHLISSVIALEASGSPTIVSPTVESLLLTGAAAIKAAIVESAAHTLGAAAAPVARQGARFVYNSAPISFFAGAAALPRNEDLDRSAIAGVSELSARLGPDKGPFAWG